MKNLKILREKKKKNQLNVAMNVGVSQEMICKYESGEVYPSVAVLIRLAKFLDTSTDYLLGLTDNPLPVTVLEGINLNKEEMELVQKFTYLAVEDKLKLMGYIDALTTIKN